MRKIISLCAALMLATVVSAQEVISLVGEWGFSTEQGKAGDYVFLPGSMLTNGKGNPVGLNTPWTGSLYDSSYYFNPALEPYRREGNFKFPFFLTPDYHYVGKAWYSRSVYVPRSWKRHRITLFLERPHIETTVFVNGKEVGHQMSLSTPHVYDITRFIKPGRKNDLRICVYNGIENVCVGQDSHSVTDQTQGNWNGIVGRIELQARPRKVNFRQVRVYPDVLNQKARVEVQLENHVNLGLPVHVMQIWEYGLQYTLTVEHKGKIDTVVTRGYAGELQGQQMSFDIIFGRRMKLWDEFHPAVYHLTLFAGEDVYETTFGMRDIRVNGRDMTLNGHTLYLRGTVENCCFPETGYPPTDVDEWQQIFRKCKEWGLNHVRFHSYCPPEAAFEAADKVGIYLQPEGPSWPNHGVRLRRGMAIDQYLLDESKRIVDTYGNHPSFLMMAAGNEPAGDWVAYCNDWVRQMHDYDSTKVYCGASVGGGWAWDSGSQYHVKGGARGLAWDKHAPSSDDDYYSQILNPRNYSPTSQGGVGSGPNNSPIVAHEQGQWCAFPDFKEISQYKGAYKPRNFELFRDLLAQNGMASQAEKFLMASGKLQTLCYKYEIERNLRTPDYTGFQLLALNDYSGQGTALVGPLNVHWRNKGYVTASEWREFCSPLVVLARFPHFVYSNADSLRVPLEIMNACGSTLTGCTTFYEIWQNESSLFAIDTISVNQIVPVGKNFPVGTVVTSLGEITKPSKMTLVVNCGNIVRNHWDFWVYPEKASKGANVSEQRNSEAAMDGSVAIYDTLSPEALSVLHDGGTVLITAAGKVTLGSDVKQSYLPVFWNTSWFKMRPPHTTGAYINTMHPLFRHDFPTDSWANINWWELLNGAQVMNLRELPIDYQPPIQPIDTWHISRKLGMMIEARVLNGRLLMTTMDITSDLDHRLVARQMRRAILSYMQSGDFNPTLTLSPETIEHFFTLQAPPVDMFTRESPDELKPKLK